MNTKLPGFVHRFTKREADLPLRARIEQACDMHRLGDHAGASSLFQALTEAHSENAELAYRYANHLKDLGAYDKASHMYALAIATNPNYLQAHCNRAVVLGLLNRPAEALESYNRALDIDPSDTITCCNRAMLLVGLGEKDAALSGFEAALEHDPNCFAAMFGRGAILQERKQWAGSFDAYRNALLVEPNNVTAHYNLAVVAEELERWDVTLASCTSAIKLNPTFSQAYARRAAVLQKLQRYEEALANFDRALEINQNDATTFNNRGVLRQTRKLFKDALSDYEQALALSPSYAEAWFNRGTALKQLGDIENAIASYNRALELRPDYAAAHVNRGTALQDRGLFREALASYEAAVRFDSTLAEAHLNLGLASLALGDFTTGWLEHEWRWRAKSGSVYREKRDFAQPLWLGRESISGRTILLYAEQGLGDCLQFCRFVPLVANLGARIILEVPRPLVRLLACLRGVDRVVAFGDPLPHFELQCPLMSLPLAFGTTLTTIPSPDAYLTIAAERMRRWRQHLGSKVKPRVGLAWSGASPKRSVALSRLIPYLPDGYDYFCLQSHVAPADQETLEASDIFQYEGLIQDFSDNAALCACMDLVISVDTSVAHLACAMGKTTWVLLAYVADWRWLLERDDTPWYRAARLFRQDSIGNWEGVFERVSKELRVKSFAAI